ncbi:predicted protein [Phaeodactylum tricornutum CCAP 1055/1]|uniref:Uncharacterized protein n=2 Tax=Phaeodactylum tricornutum TaxID=2850 RepID=B5Y4U4_PHATC|nr:predicted protein [Phaeodactylum tricornutum CCAP 1055/1]ACI65826.1 predicted protein [Phaeodactylum tricornutum CCAP 1055/1]|eukprot:XP_002186356.1 predicted protein [Phaeodactylum tricornutum CCAP 1055/1]
MKLSFNLIVAAVAISGASAYSVPSRSSLRSLGQKSVSAAPRRQVGSASLKMEGKYFGFMKGSKFSFDDEWEGVEIISEVAIEKRLNKDGLRYKMNRTEKEADEVGRLAGLPGITLNLPIIGETYLGPPKVASIWEALGFTATSNNEARQLEKMKAIEGARNAKKGVLNGPGKEQRGEWLKKYGYPRLVGSGGIFYADQLSTDKEPMGGFNMGKSGSIWPVPDVVEAGQYGGAKGWGMKKKGPAVDGLPAEKRI